ncbi:MAG: hypothetical protein BWK79_19695 [Beggiatoa sp. IS2]|nr:MAG: hypothetical protein BWK79_19695 [Beggiatoa sp. IS2]
MSDKRKFVRHPTSVPLKVWQETDDALQNYETLRDIGLGGLSFSSSVEWQKDMIVCIQIPMVERTFQMAGKVAWCKPHDTYFDVGVEFMVKKEDSERRDLIVDKICQIEAYKNLILQIAEEVSHIEYAEYFTID